MQSNDIDMYTWHVLQKAQVFSMKERVVDCGIIDFPYDHTGQDMTNLCYHQLSLLANLSCCTQPKNDP